MPGRKDSAIGVFDSGLGGLTVARALMRQLPYEDIVYFGDTARVPYGTKSPESIIRFSNQNVEILLRHKVKMVVVACNSSSSYALSSLTQNFRLPIVGVIEPGVRKALAVTRNKIIGVIATPATINSGSYTGKLKDLGGSVKVVTQPCPLFVPLVEEGWFDRPVTRVVAAEYLKKIKGSKADTLILGCTHYPLLKSVLRRVMGPAVSLVDSAQEVALEVRQLLQNLGLARTARRKADYRFLISDEPRHFQKSARRFLGYNVSQVERVTI